MATTPGAGKMIRVESLAKDYVIKRPVKKSFPLLRLIRRRETETIRAINNVTFSIEKGEMVACIGPNGAGKSTLLKMLTGILYPTSGDIEVFGFNPWKHRRDLSYRIGVVFGQKSQLLYHLPLIESFRLFADVYDLKRSQFQDELQLLVQLFSLEPLLDFPVRKMSLGQRMKCEIAASLLHRPELLFLDEPTIGLDVISKQQIRNALLGLNLARSTTLVLTSHDSEDIKFVCRRALVVNHGTVCFDDSIEAIAKKFLVHKKLKLTFEGNEAPSLNIPGVEMLAHRGNELELAVDERYTSCSQIIKMLLEKYEVLDFAISNPSMDEIIWAVFTETNKAIDGERGQTEC